MTDRSLTKLAWLLCAMTLLILMSSLLLDTARLVDAAAARGGAVAGSGHLPGRDRGRAHPRRPHQPRAVPATPTDGCGSASG